MGRGDEKPIWGFGPVGWVAAAVLAGLIVFAVSARDPRYELQKVIHEIWGWPGSHWFVTRGLSPHWATYQFPRFHVISVLYVIGAMRLAHRRMGWWRYALVVTAGLLPACLIFSVPRGLLEELEYAGAVLAALTLFVVTGSWRMGAFVGGITVGVKLVEDSISPRLIGGWGFNDYRWVTIAWHIVFGGGMIGWAVRDRLAAPKPWHCGVCGYDLRGGSDDICPECGTAHRWRTAGVPPSRAD